MAVDQIGAGVDTERGSYRDVHIEQFLLTYVEKKFIGYEPAGRIEALVLHSALRAQVRPGTKDGVLPHLVDRYVLMRREGMLPPPAIVHDLHDGRFELLDARQRVEAAKHEGAETIPWYVLTTDDTELLWTIALRANEELNGEPPSATDVELQILAYKDEHPSISNKALAAKFKRTEHYISDVLNRSRVIARLDALGFKTAAASPADPASKPFTPAVIKRLGSLRDDRVLQSAAQLVRDARLTPTEANSLVIEVNDRRSEDERLAVIATKRENGLGPRIRKAELGATDPRDQHNVRDRLLRRSRVLAQELNRYTSAGAAEMTDPQAAAEFWSYVVTIEAAARRIVGAVARPGGQL